MRSVLVAGAVLVGMLVGVPSAGAVNIDVNTTQDTYGASAASCSLREAITSAQTDAAFDGCTAGSGADVVRLPSGEYKITRSGSGENANVTGDFDVTGTGTLSVEPADAGAKVVVDGNGLDRVFDQQGNNSFAIRNLQVKGGVLTQIGEDGGGIANTVGSMSLEGVTVSANITAYSGGGIAVYSTLSMINSTLSGNKANGSGGGLYVTGGASAAVRSSTITKNVADADATVNGDGGGIRNTASTVSLTNTINAGNQDLSVLPADRSPDCYSDPTTFPRFVLTTQALGTAPCLTGPDPGNNQVVPDAMLGDLADNGGQTPTHALLTGSPAIGTGGTAAPDQCPATDQTGRTRPAGSCDIGAVQYVAPAPPTPANLLIDKIKPAKGKVKRGKTIKIKLTIRNGGGSAAAGVNACLELKAKKTRKALKVKGPKCKSLGSIAAGASKTATIKLSARKNAKKKSFSVGSSVTGTGLAKGTKTFTVKVK